MALPTFHRIAWSRTEPIPILLKISTRCAYGLTDRVWSLREVLMYRKPLFRLGDALAATGSPEVETLTAAVLAIRR